MKENMRNAINKSHADYCDMLVEDTRFTTISFNKLEIQNVSSTVLKGGRVMALVNGGYSSASFTRMDGMEDAVKSATAGAETLSKFDNTNRMVPAPVIQDTVIPEMKIDPRTVDFDAKVELARDYIKLVMDTPQVFTSYGSYTESFTRKTYVNSEGTEIEQDIILCFFSCRIMAKNGNKTESLGFTIGFDADYDRLLNRHDYARSRAETCVALLKAKSVSPGIYNIVVDQDLSGIFTHEAFGHLSEADDSINNKSLQEMLVIGKRLGGDNLNIIDDGSISGSSGTYIYDDQGVRATRTYLVKNGILTGRLHSRLSAAQLNGELTGNYRACDYRFRPLVRMSNIFIENGETEFNALLEAAGDGLYLCGGKGGQTMGDLFTFGAQYGYEIKNGKLGGMVKDINISGNVFETLGNIALVGNDLKMSEGGGCGKSRAGLFDMQMMDKSGVGGPSMLINNVVIGGE